MSELLKRTVESIVNPVHAFEGRKVEWREELLAHLSDLLGECAGDETEALRRFGDPALIRRELQASVPVWERVAGFHLIPDPPRLWYRRLWQGSQEPAFRYGCRLAACLAAAQVAVFVLGIVGGLIWRSGQEPSSAYVVRVLSVGLPMCLMTFLVLAPLAAFAAVRTTPSRLLLNGAAVSLWLFLVMIAYTALQNSLGHLLFPSNHYGLMAGEALLAPLIFRWIGHFARREHNQYRRWRDMEPTVK